MKIKILIFFGLFLALMVFGEPLYAADVPKPQPVVPCNTGNNPNNGEFHSLRPYQSSPCDGLNVTSTSISCGNDLILKKQFTRTVDQGTNCCLAGPSGICGSGTGDPWIDQTICEYSDNQNQANVSIDLSEARFPIEGNTENVVNRYDNGKTPTADSAQKLNEFVSWYLNGTNYKAEDGSLRILDTDYFVPGSDVQKLINLSGPLEKLLPERMKRVLRLDTTATANVTNHNQVVGCVDANTGKSVGCTQAGITNHSQIAKRLSDLSDPVQPNLGLFGQWIATTPPLEEYSYFKDSNGKFNFDKYWKAYQEWLGRNCFPLIGCVNIQALVGLRWSDMFKMVPLAPTEDKVGNLEVDPTLTVQPADEVEISDLDFTSDDATHRLYFAHTIENSKLANLLQETYTSKDIKADALDSALEANALYNTQRCEVADARTNPGDNLFGNYNQGGDSPITGHVSYTANFSCTFPPPTIDPVRMNSCINTILHSKDNVYPVPTNGGCAVSAQFGDPTQIKNFNWILKVSDLGTPGNISCTINGYTDYPVNLCNDTYTSCTAITPGAGLSAGNGIGEAIYNSCREQAKIPPPACVKHATAALSVYTRTPEVNDLWARTVNGSAAIFKRMFPKVGVGQPVANIDDIPAVTNAKYQSDAEQTLAGDPNLNRSGANAQIYFPHVGGIYNYFLKDMQRALRPQGLN